MKRIMFVCHGNICRSTMAEFMFKDMMKDYDLVIDSCATSNEEIGNDTHYGTKQMLDKYHIAYQKRRAYRITQAIYDQYDYIICMDQNNINNLSKIVRDNTKAKLLLSYAGINRNIKDPWYTGDFEATYQDIKLGLEGLKTTVLEDLK